MALSIRNPRAEKLAREVAAESKESLTEAIIHARRTATDVAGEIMKISRRCRALPEKDPRSPDEVLGYDDRGLLQ
jgi:antitoxin VapB